MDTKENGIFVCSLRECSEQDWYSYPEDHRSPRGSWVESITISARASTQRDEKQPLEIRIRLIGEYRDGIIELTYKNVQSYLLEGMRDIAGHGDWLEDEVKVNRHDQLKHKVTVTNGTFVIEAEDIEFKWKPLPRYSEQP